jgi:hypothetical protein
MGTKCKGHKNFDFVDIRLDKDNRVFIDPCLMEEADDPWCIQASQCMAAFFDCLYTGFKNETIRHSALLSHAGEQNAIKLGYGDGSNGKGKTPVGMYESLEGLSALIHQIPTIGKAQDIPVFISDFAEDRMSDLLANILHHLLGDFTAAQMSKWGYFPDGEGTKPIWFFDAAQKLWRQEARPCWFYQGKELLLVPKKIVRKHYLFSAHQYLQLVILERMRQAEPEWRDLKKADMRHNLPQENRHWEYEHVIAYSREHPEALTEYHKVIPTRYTPTNGSMMDDELDDCIYR